MKVAVATISFGDKDDRRTLCWYGDEGEVGQLYLENEALGTDCYLDDVRKVLKHTYPKKFWDLVLLDSFLAI